MKAQKQTHNIPPVFDENSRILILGSFPSVKSRESRFFYGHPQNRFWKVLARLFDEEIPKETAQKKQLLISRNIAVWDVIESCTIAGSSDTSITDVRANDLSVIIKAADIRAIFCNGSKSFELYNKYAANNTGIKADKLPSTSPANAAYSLDKLCDEWKKILKYI